MDEKQTIAALQDRLQSYEQRCLKAESQLAQMQKALRKAKRDLGSIFRLIPENYFVKDRELRYVEVNAGFLKAIGKSEEDVIGKRVEEIFAAYPERVAQYQQADRELMKKGFQSYETQLSLCDGLTHDVLISKSVLKDEEGRFDGIIGVVSDLSTLKEAERKLEQALFKADEANRSKSQFLANMSHEIRTPMNAIIGFSELLQKSELGSKERHYLQVITSSSKTLLTLINDILDLSKIEAGKMNLSYEKVDLAHILRELADIFSLSAQQKKLSLQLEIPQGLPKGLYFDEIRLRQILLNIINNAIKFTKEGFVRITVRYAFARRGTLSLDIDIADSGIGIDAAQQKRIFNLFEQRDGQNTREFDGTGLGLSISKNLAELMGGEILVESQAGAGSTFTLHFEGVMCDEHSSESDADIDESEQYHFEKATIVVVDDILSNRTLIESMFEGSAVEVLSAANGEEGVALAKTYHPDMILMDIRMPEMDGHEALAKLKADPELAGIPVIALTASVVEKDETYYRCRGFDAFLEKPFEAEALYVLMRRFLVYNDTEVSAKTPQQRSGDISRAQVTAMLAFMQGDAYARYESLRYQNSFEAYEHWARALYDEAQKQNFEYVKVYAKDLLEAIEAFDVVMLRRSIDAYDALIQSVKALRKREL